MTDRMDKIIAAGEECGEAFALAERRAIVEWMRSEAQKCDCFAREDSECACGAWGGEVGERTYKRVYIEDIADAVESEVHLAKNGG
jgi:hypothetical protein